MAQAPAHSRGKAPESAANPNAGAAMGSAARPGRQATVAAHALAAASPRAAAPAQFAGRIAGSPRMVAQRQALRDSLGAAVQLKEPEEQLLQNKFAVQREAMPGEEEPLQGKFETAQLEGIEEEESLQGKFERVTGSTEAVQRKVNPTTEVDGVPINDDPWLEHEADMMGDKAAQFVPSSGGSGEVAQQEMKHNDTGLPDKLKAGIENLSGRSMDGVKVHYNSKKPAQLYALAYAQGTDIHVGPGQEQHLPHEAWHVVQQAHNGEAVQRVVINFEVGDPIIDESAKIQDAKAPTKTGHNKPVASTDKFFWQLFPLHKVLEGKEGEEITIVAHGTPAFGDEPAKVGGRTALELFQDLERIGFTKALTGDVNLSCCTTAWARSDKQLSFAEEFSKTLKLNGYSNRVVGCTSFATTEPDGTETQSVDNKREALLAQLILGRVWGPLEELSNDPKNEKSRKELINIWQTIYVEIEKQKAKEHPGDFRSFYVHIEEALVKACTTDDKDVIDKVQVKIMELKTLYKDPGCATREKYKPQIFS